VTVGDDTRADPGDLQAERRAVGSPPLLVADPAAGGTGLILFPRTDSLPAAWVGLVPAAGLESADVAALLAAARPCPLLPQQGEGWFGRPGLSGHRLGHGTGDPAAGRTGRRCSDRPSPSVEPLGMAGTGFCVPAGQAGLPRGHRPGYF